MTVPRTGCGYCGHRSSELNVGNLRGVSIYHCTLKGGRILWGEVLRTEGRSIMRGDWKTGH